MPSFSANIDAWIQKTGLKANVVLRRIALEALRGVILKSPVDTGRFRSSWRVGVNTVDLTVEPPVTGGGTRDSAGRLRDAGGRFVSGEKSNTNKEGAISSAKFGDSIYITNNIPYGPRLEGGYSKQAPNGMVRLTFEEVKANLERLVQAA